MMSPLNNVFTFRNAHRGSGGNDATLRENSIVIIPEHCLQRINAKSYRAIFTQSVLYYFLLYI
jgi:hypothetical protein